MLQLWAPELFDDVGTPPELPLVSAQWLWAALSKDPKTALAELVAAKSDTWLTWLTWLCFQGHKDIELHRIKKHKKHGASEESGS